MDPNVNRFTSFHLSIFSPFLSLIYLMLLFFFHAYEFSISFTLHFRCLLFSFPFSFSRFSLTLTLFFSVSPYAVIRTGPFAPTCVHFFTYRLLKLFFFFSSVTHSTPSSVTVMTEDTQNYILCSPQSKGSTLF